MEWIKVEDRLPNIGEEVLVWCGKKEGEIYLEVKEPSNAIVKFKTIRYSSLVDCDAYEVFASGITHWQPLPKAPK